MAITILLLIAVLFLWRISNLLYLGVHNMATQEQVDALTAAVTDLTATTAEAVASITASKNEPTIDVEGITTAITTASDTLKTALAPTEPTPPAEDQTPVE